MINQFKGDYRWLSNLYLCEVQFRGERYASVEYAYMSAKSDDPDWKQACAEAEVSQRKIKQRSQELTLVPNWADIKLGVMRECLASKFSQEPLKTWLLETGALHLEEGNTWGDTFWGVDWETGEGENNLGKLLMEIREELRAGGKG